MLLGGLALALLPSCEGGPPDGTTTRLGQSLNAGTDTALPQAGGQPPGVAFDLAERAPVRAYRRVDAEAGLGTAGQPPGQHVA